MKGLTKRYKVICNGVLICIFVTTMAWVLLTSTPNLFLGDIFFGKTESLYNVNLAQYFYSRAAYPLIGNPVKYAHYQFSRTFFIKGQFYSALKEAKKELEIYPDNDRTYYILGLTYGYLNIETEAIEAFSRFIDKHPTTWAGRNDKAWLQFRIGDIEGALETITPVSGNFNPWVQNTYGTILMNLRRYAEARQAFLHAQELVAGMEESKWGSAYPGNDPRVYSTGLEAMKLSIQSNLDFLEKQDQSYPQN